MVPNDQAQLVPNSSPYGVFMSKSFQESPIHSYMVHVAFNAILLITCPFEIEGCLCSFPFVHMGKCWAFGVAK